MLDLRESIIEGKLEEFVNDFLKNWFQKEEVPKWVLNALEHGKINVNK